MSPYHHHLTCQQVYCEKKRKKEERESGWDRERKKERKRRKSEEKREREREQFLRGTVEEENNKIIKCKATIAV